MKQKLKDTDVLTYDIMSQLGFHYNYFEGFICEHKSGLYISSCGNFNKVMFKGETYECKTVKDVYDLIKLAENSCHDSNNITQNN